MRPLNPPKTSAKPPTETTVLTPTPYGVLHVEQRDREPAKRAGRVATAVVAVAFAYNLITAEQAAAWDVLLVAAIAAIAPWLQAKYIRHRVMPVDTITAAGLDPEVVNKMADDPSVKPFRETPAVG